jgi:hypothetical protein
MGLFGKPGLVLLPKDIGRSYVKASGNYALGKVYPAGGGRREAERAAKRIARAKAKAGAVSS